MNAFTSHFDTPSMRILEQSPGEPLRGATERLIRSRYAEVHDASLETLMPKLIGCFDDRDRPLAALGYRGAAEGPLFLEQYFDTPIERLVQLRGEGAGPVATIDRSRIVEVGSFASRDRRAAALMLQALPERLARRGFEWLVFTGTPRVCSLVASFGAPLVDLGHADSGRLQGDASRWGRYYDRAPRVMAGWLGHRVQVAA